DVRLGPRAPPAGEVVEADHPLAAGVDRVEVGLDLGGRSLAGEDRHQRPEFEEIDRPVAVLVDLGEGRPDLLITRVQRGGSVTRAAIGRARAQGTGPAPGGHRAGRPTDPAGIPRPRALAGLPGAMR